MNKILTESIYSDDIRYWRKIVIENPALLSEAFNCGMTVQEMMDYSQNIQDYDDWALNR
jgi:hypothetical protein